ncbi:MAG: autotransporter outer membrane beta-barrel domain-containing protein, partial [Lentilitoribacter sp.]
FASADRFSNDDRTTSNLVVKRNEDHEPEPQGFNVNDRTGSWDIWTQINGSKSTQTNLKSEFWSANFGTHYFISNDVLVGMLTQFDWAEEINHSTGSTVSGNGFMVGPYVAGKVKDQNLYYEARALWGKSSNDVTPIGTYTDNFETERWLASLKVQGSYDLNDEVTIKPEVSLSYFKEKQDAYTDSNSNLIPEQTISLGEFKFGPTVTRQFDVGNGYTMRTSAGLSGIANFSVKSAYASSSNTFANEKLRARLDAEVEVENEYGIRFTAAGYYDGIGASDFQSYGGTFGLIIPLQ